MSKPTNLSELFNDEFDSISNLEILNTFPNSHEIPFTKKDLDNMVNTFNEFKERHHHARKRQFQ